MPTSFDHRILLLEDSKHDAILLERVLEKAGLTFEIKLVCEREEFITALAKFEPTVVLSDYTLPRFDPMSALQIARFYNESLPFILVTGTVSEEFAVEILSAGADDYILKSGLGRLPIAILNATEKRKNETTNQKLASLIQSSTELVGLADMDGKMTFLNEIGYQMLGLERKYRLNSFSLYELFPEEDRSFFIKDIINHIHMEDNWIGEFKLWNNKTKQSIPIILRAFFIKHSRTRAPFSIGVVCRDISETKEIIQREKLTAIKYQSVLEESNQFFNLSYDLLCITSIGGSFIRGNPSWSKLLGYDENEFTGKPLITFVHPDDRIKTIKVFEGLNNGEDVLEFENRFTCANGDTKWLMWTALAVRERKRVFAIARDITERKKMEKELKTKISELDTFIYRSSHDLKGPLSSLQGLVNIAKQEIKDPEAIKYLDLIEKSNKKMEEILSSLVEIAKITQGGVKMTQIDPMDLTNEIFHSLVNLPNSSKIKMKVKSNKVASIKSDRTLLSSIIQNLVHNSINYHNPSQEKPEITIIWNKDNKGVYIEIADNGLGIEDSVKPKVFDMFFRGNVSSKGSGLGLYIVKSAVEKLKGTIAMQSDHSKGTIFKIFLPGS